MITFRIFVDIEELCRDLQAISQVEYENNFILTVRKGPIAGRYLFGGEKGEFEYRFFDIELNEDIQILRAASNLDQWYLSLLYGNIRLLSQALNNQLTGVIATAELHNLKKDDTVIFKAPGHVWGSSIRMGRNFLLASTNQTEKYFPFVDETAHFAMVESLDHEMIERLTGIFRINKDSPVFSKRIETAAKDISYYFLEKIANRKNDLNSMVPDDSIIQKMLHANSLFNDYNHPPSLQQISRYVGMGPSKTHDLFKKVYGKTPYQYFSEKRLNEAYDLIHTGKYNIAQIGTMLGFANMSHFSKAFSKRFGVLPKKMQKLRMKL